MASPQGDSNYPHYNDHARMWSTFTAISKWVVIATIILVILMAAFLTGDHQTLR
jgi:hypothetical protein